MRVNSKKLFNLLKSLRLDQSSYRLTKDLVCLTEKLAAHQQDLTFLRRCKAEKLTPRFLEHRLINLQYGLHQSNSLKNLVARVRQTILSLTIKKKYGDIDRTKQLIQKTREKCDAALETKIDDLLRITRLETKRKKKFTLRRKFDQLKPSSNNESKVQSTQQPSERVSIIDDIDVSPTAIEILAKGPKFAITPTVSKESLQHTVQLEVAALAYAMRWNTVMKNLVPNSTKHPSVAKVCPFHSYRKEPPREDPATEKTIQGLQLDMQRLVEKCDIRMKPNITKAGIRAIHDLTAKEDTVITKSDKGGEFVVMKTSHLRQLCQEHLTDTSTYEKLKSNPTDNIRQKVNKNLGRILKLRGFPENVIHHLRTPPSAKTQQFYALPKTHKEVLKIRPILSASGGIFDRIGWLLQFILKPLLRHVTAHLRSTADLVSHLESIDQQRLAGKIPVSFDVISLYTNVDTEEAIATALEYTLKYKLFTHGLQNSDLWELLHLVLDNNIFAYENTGFYKQIRGLAMGSRLSGTLAIICLDRFERMHIYQELQPKPIIYVRYVDDVGTVVDSVEHSRTTLAYLNSKHRTIQFEVEIPNDTGFLPILDMKIKIRADGHIERKLFTKAANKGITLNYGSHHPTAVKIAVADNEFRRAQTASSQEHRAEAFRMTKDKLRNNGYPEKLASVPHSTRGQKKKKRKPTHESNLILKIPFISDAFNHKVRHLLNKHNVAARVVNCRDRTLRDLTKANQKQQHTICHSTSCPAPDICQHASVVYSATCQLCDQSYIGMTTRKLHERAREHVTAARHHDRHSAFGQHYESHHPKATPDIKFIILRRQKDLLRLHIEEAMAIRTFKPTLNRRQEDLGTGFLP